MFTDDVLETFIISMHAKTSEKQSLCSNVAEQDRATEKGLRATTVG